jgi:hypothetical protein
MNERIEQLSTQAVNYARENFGTDFVLFYKLWQEKFAELIVKECIDKIETHQIPVGNSVAGEMACEWTYAALKEIRDEIKQHFGVEE